MEKALDVGPDRWSDVSRIFAAAAGLDGAIYGLESAGVVALVLALVEGATPAERLAVGPVPFDEVVRIAR